MEAGGGTVRGAAVVLALPPALAAEGIDFEPPLPDDVRRLASATPVWMGAMTKVVACYDRPFWRDRGLAGAVISHVGPLREVHDMCGPNGTPAALFGFVPPTFPGSPTVSREAALGQLGQLFGPSAAEPTDLFVRDWRAETHTSPPGVERLQAYEVFGHAAYFRPHMAGRLHWASTETAREAPGHVEGALAAGSRAAEAILRSGRS